MDLLAFRAYWLKQRKDPNYYKVCDFNDDGVINLRDLAVFADEWNPAPPNGSSALKRASAVDIYDLDAFSNDWLATAQ